MEKYSSFSECKYTIQRGSGVDGRSVFVACSIMLSELAGVAILLQLGLSIAKRNRDNKSLLLQCFP